MQSYDVSQLRKHALKALAFAAIALSTSACEDFGCSGKDDPAPETRFAYVQYINASTIHDSLTFNVDDNSGKANAVYRQNVPSDTSQGYVVNHRPGNKLFTYSIDYNGTTAVTAQPFPEVGELDSCTFIAYDQSATTVGAVVLNDDPTIPPSNLINIRLINAVPSMPVLAFSTGGIQYSAKYVGTAPSNEKYANQQFTPSATGLLVLTVPGSSTALASIAMARMPRGANYTLIAHPAAAGSSNVKLQLVQHK